MDVVQAGDLLAVMTAGAYGATMASTYNSRALTPEVLVSGDKWAVVRERPPIETLIEGDIIPDWARSDAQPASLRPPERPSGHSGWRGGGSRGQGTTSPPRRRGNRRRRRHEARRGGKEGV